jgi:SAM-dependent methyltransferase
MSHASQTPSAWVTRWAHLLPPGGSLLDVACGSGRHLRWAAAQGLKPTGVDRDAAALQGLQDLAEVVVADIENGPWPLAGRRFDVVLVTHYLWRPLVPVLLASLAPGGWLLWETFAAGNETVGKPSRPDFLLQPGELLAIAAPLRVVAYEDGFLPAPERFVQRILARQPLTGQAPARHLLAAG